jgi:hypothetical protein
MTFNLKSKKFGAFALITGGIMIVILVIFALNVFFPATLPEDNNQPPPPSSEKGIGYRIASRMAAAEENVSYVWCYNNTWVNLNLSNHYYPEFIDGVRIGLMNDTSKMALIHEPNAEIRDIDRQDLNTVMVNFRGAITVLNDTNQSLTDIMQIWPPTFICDVAYEDGTSLSLMFSKEHQVLSVLNGTWTLSQWHHYGINSLIFNYSDDDLVFLPLSDMQLFLQAIESFESLIYATFPV